MRRRRAGGSLCLSEKPPFHGEQSIGEHCWSEQGVTPASTGRECVSIDQAQTNMDIENSCNCLASASLRCLVVLPANASHQHQQTRHINISRRVTSRPATLQPAEQQHVDANRRGQQQYSQATWLPLTRRPPGSH